MKLGYHISIQDKIYKAIDRGEELNCEAIQIFTTSPQSWNFKMPSENDLDIFKKKWRDSKIIDIVAHSIYLVNLASFNPYIQINSINSVLQGLAVSEKLGLMGLITHVGSHKGRGVSEGTKKIVENITKIFHDFDGKSSLILEISSGSGDTLGRNFKEIKGITDILKDDRIGICIDTAHAFESGYDLRTKNVLEKMLEEVDNYIGIEKLKVLHINDSKTEFNSNKDRHEDIGKGYLGVESFRNIVNNKFLKDLPGIMETPSMESGVKNMSNLELLRSLEK